MALLLSLLRLAFVGAAQLDRQLGAFGVADKFAGLLLSEMKKSMVLANGKYNLQNS